MNHHITGGSGVLIGGHEVALSPNGKWPFTEAFSVAHYHSSPIMVGRIATLGHPQGYISA